MKINNNDNGLVSGLSILVFVLVIGLIAGSGDASTNRCIKSGCSNTRASGSSYCYIHKPYNGSSTRSNASCKDKSTSAEKEGGKSAETGKTATSIYSRNSTSNRSSGTTNTRVYNSLNNDPEDYDDPEEYADDAWGDDFDDWDDAYDYWEDY